MNWIERLAPENDKKRHVLVMVDLWRLLGAVFYKFMFIECNVYSMTCKMSWLHFPHSLEADIEVFVLFSDL